MFVSIVFLVLAAYAIAAPEVEGKLNVMMQKALTEAIAKPKGI